MGIWVDILRLRKELDGIRNLDFAGPNFLSDKSLEISK